MITFGVISAGVSGLGLLIAGVCVGRQIGIRTRTIAPLAARLEAERRVHAVTRATLQAMRDALRNQP